MTNQKKQKVYWGIIWAASLGLAGFIFGYFGNFLLSKHPDNLAPLIGILFTGPIALILGAILGVVQGSTQSDENKVKLRLTIAIAMVALISLAVTAPSYKPDVQLVEAKILSCENISKLLQKRIDHWHLEVARATQSNLAVVRKGWEKDILTMVSKRPGIVLELQLMKSTWLKKRVWRGNFIQQKVDPWKSEIRKERVYFDDARSTCEKKQIDKHDIYLLDYERSKGFPPSGLVEFLGLRVLKAVPESYSEYLPR